MKRFQLILLIFCATMSFAQTTTDSVIRRSNFRRPVSLESNSGISNQLQAPASLNMYQFYRKNLSDHSWQKPTINISSFSDNYVPSIDLTNNPYNQYPINNWSWINTSRTSSNYYGLGGVYMINANYTVKMGSIGLITGGIYASKYNIYNNFSNSTGLNGNVKFILSDRISINTFGQYSISGSKNGLPLYLSTLYPTSFYGGSIELKVTSKWGIITGAEQEFDVFSRKWVTRPFIMPVFYGH